MATIYKYEDEYFELEKITDSGLGFFICLDKNMNRITYRDIITNQEREGEFETRISRLIIDNGVIVTNTPTQQTLF